jgi:hypothetical protein
VQEIDFRICYLRKPSVWKAGSNKRSKAASFLASDKARFAKLLGQLGNKIGLALPIAFQDWAATKAAYRFFDNTRVNESINPTGHFVATASRIAATKGPVLVLHDTT